MISALSAFILICSCTKEKEKPPYIGIWTATEIQQGFEMKDSLTLTENSFEDIIMIGLNNQWEEYMGIKGTIEASGNNLHLTVTSVAMAQLNIYSGEVISGLQWYEEGSPGFNQYIDHFGNPVMDGEYYIEGDEMTTKLDMDGDGEYISYGEITVYTKP